MCWNSGAPMSSAEGVTWLWGQVVCLGLIAFSFLGLTVIVVGGIYVLRRRMMVNYFRNKAVFITGADKGIGLSVVKELDRMGLKVFAGCHSKAGAASLEGVVSDRVKTVVVEVTDRQSVENARKVVEADLPPNGLWGLVNNAGIARGMAFDFAQLDDYRQVLDVNFFGVLQVTEVFLPLIKKSRGRVVNMSSIMGRFSGVMGPYSCSKFALEAYTDGLRRSLKPFGVLVSAIEPGFYKTKMTDRKYIEDEIERLYDALPKHLKEDYSVEAKDKAKQKFGEFVENPPLSHWNNVEGVAQDVVHALGALYPWSRYVCGLDAQLLYRWAAMIPDCLVDTFFPLVGPSHCYLAPRHSTSTTSPKDTEEMLIHNISHNDGN